MSCSEGCLELAFCAAPRAYGTVNGTLRRLLRGGARSIRCLGQRQQLGLVSVGRECHSYACCSSGLRSRNSCGENYIFKVGLNVFHCWKICHFPLQIPAPPCPSFLPTLLTLFALTEACLFLFLCQSLFLPLDAVQKGWAVAWLSLLSLRR